MLRQILSARHMHAHSVRRLPDLPMAAGLSAASMNGVLPRPQHVKLQLNTSRPAVSLHHVTCIDLVCGWSAIERKRAEYASRYDRSTHVCGCLHML
jgi:hypothetical protein